MYVPIKKLEKFLSMPKGKLEVSLLKSIHKKPDSSYETQSNIQPRMKLSQDMFNQNNKAEDKIQSQFIFVDPNDLQAHENLQLHKKIQSQKIVQKKNKQSKLSLKPIRSRLN